MVFSLQQDLDEKVYAITLQISEITLDSFTNYTFFVSNNVGDLSRTISLERGKYEWVHEYNFTFYVSAIVVRTNCYRTDSTQ